MTVITIKKSSVEGKVPDAADLAVAELAVNLKDRKLYTKDADGNVVALGGEAQVPGGDTPPTDDNKPGDLFWDTATEQLLYGTGSEWLPIAGDEAIGITECSLGLDPELWSYSMVVLASPGALRVWIWSSLELLASRGGVWV